jgi:hypothetical protein
VKATEAQKNKMRKLGIVFCDDITLEEAREALLAENNNKPTPRKNVTDVGYDSIVENSSWED